MLTSYVYNLFYFLTSKIRILSVATKKENTNVLSFLISFIKNYSAAATSSASTSPSAFTTTFTIAFTSL